MITYIRSVLPSAGAVAGNVAVTAVSMCAAGVLIEGTSFVLRNTAKLLTNAANGADLLAKDTKPFRDNPFHPGFQTSLEARIARAAQNEIDRRIAAGELVYANKPAPQPQAAE